MKNSAIAFFFEERNDPKVWKIFIETLLPKKIHNFHCPSWESSIIRQMAKKKHKKNITGLRNQSKTTSHVKEAPDDSIAKAVETAPTHTAFHADIDDFVNQVSLLETLIKEAGHECIFLPKFHCVTA